MRTMEAFYWAAWFMSPLYEVPRLSTGPIKIYTAPAISLAKVHTSSALVRFAVFCEANC